MILSERIVVESRYIIVGLIILLFTIITCCRDIDIEITRLANDFVLLSRISNEDYWLSSG